MKLDMNLMEFKRAVSEVKRLLDKHKTLGFFLYPRARDNVLVCQWNKERVMGRLRRSKFLIYSGTLKRLLQKSKKLEDFLY